MRDGRGDALSHLRAATCHRPPANHHLPLLTYFVQRFTFQDMKKILIIVPDGGMLFESAGIADILMQANRLHAEGLRARYRVAPPLPSPTSDPRSVRAEPACRPSSSREWIR